MISVYNVLDSNNYRLKDFIVNRIECTKKSTGQIGKNRYNEF